MCGPQQASNKYLLSQWNDCRRRSCRGTGSALLCWRQRRDLHHQRGEAAFLTLYLPQPSPWNSTNWTSYTMCPLPHHPVYLSSLGVWELQSLDPRAFCAVDGYTAPLSWQVCSRVSRELGSLGQNSDLGSMTAPDPGDKCVNVTDKHQIRKHSTLLPSLILPFPRMSSDPAVAIISSCLSKRSGWVGMRICGFN